MSFCISSIVVHVNLRITVRRQNLSPEKGKFFGVFSLKWQLCELSEFSHLYRKEKLRLGMSPETAAHHIDSVNLWFWVDMPSNVSKIHIKAFLFSIFGGSKTISAPMLKGIIRSCVFVVAMNSPGYTPRGKLRCHSTSGTGGSFWLPVFSEEQMIITIATGR